MIPSPARVALWLLAPVATVFATDPSPDLPPLPAWTITAESSLAAGYRDNLLLSPTRPDRSALLRATVEVMALKVPVGMFDGYAYLDLIETRYLSGRDTDHERSAILASEARWQPNPALRAAWSLQAYHQDQVLDVSVTETDLSIAQLQVTGFATGPVVRWTPAPLWLEAKTAFRRDTYRDDLDGYDDAEGALALGYTWGHGSELSAGATHRLRDHDSRQQFTVSGRPIAGTLLETRQTDAHLAWLHVFDSPKKPRLTVTLTRQWSRDNGTGYFDYDRESARARFTWKNDAWENEVTAEANRYRFPVQFIGLGINPDHRRKNELRFTWELTRRFSDRLSAFLFLEREQSRSNDDRSRFTVHTAYAGVRFSWDSLASYPP